MARFIIVSSSGTPCMAIRYCSGSEEGGKGRGGKGGGREQRSGREKKKDLY